MKGQNKSARRRRPQRQKTGCEIASRLPLRRTTIAPLVTPEPIFRMDDAEFFFQCPPDKRAIQQAGQTKHSTLSALRGDVDFCMGIDRSIGTPPPVAPRRALWSGAITIMAGIDLLAKFYAGCDDTARGKVGERFKTFVKKWFGLSEGHAAILYQLRNSLMHSYSLWCQIDGCHIDLVSGHHQHLITSDPSGKKIVDLLVLYQEFEGAINKYQGAVKSSSGLQAAFARMFLEYGSFFTYPLSLSPTATSSTACPPW